MCLLLRALILTFEPSLLSSRFSRITSFSVKLPFFGFIAVLTKKNYNANVGESKLERVAFVFGGRPKSEGENWEEMPKFVSD